MLAVPLGVDMRRLRNSEQVNDQHEDGNEGVLLIRKVADMPNKPCERLS